MATKQRQQDDSSIAKMQQPLEPDTLNFWQRMQVRINLFFDRVSEKDIERVSKSLKPAFSDATAGELAQVARAKIRYEKLDVSQLRTLYDAWKTVRDDPVFKGTGNDRLEFEAFNKLRGQNEGFVHSIAANATEWKNDAGFNVAIGDRGKISGVFTLKTDYSLNNQIYNGYDGQRYESGSRAQASWLKTIAHGFLDPQYGTDRAPAPYEARNVWDAEFQKRIAILNVLKEY